MKTVCSFLVIAGFGLLMAGCKKDNASNDPGQATWEYTGNTAVTIRYYEYNVFTGQDDFIEEKQYSFVSFVTVSPPMSTGGTTETNAFNLQIHPDRNVTAEEEGHIDLISAMKFTTSTGEALLQYWNYSMNGDQISGTLTDAHNAEAAAGNIVWAWDDVAGIKITMPFGMAVGTVLSGTLTSSSVSLTITGESIDTYRKFSCTVNATRN